MQPNAFKLLEDIRDACAFVLECVAAKTLDDFSKDRLLYQAVERNFEIMGEALNRLKKKHPRAAAKIGDFPRIVAFRNILIHGYDIIDREIVWRVIHDNLPSLKCEVENLLSQPENDA